MKDISIQRNCVAGNQLTKGLGSRKQVNTMRNMYSLKLKSVVLFLKILNLLT